MTIYAVNEIKPSKEPDESRHNATFWDYDKEALMYYATKELAEESLAANGYKQVNGTAWYILVQTNDYRAAVSMKRIEAIEVQE